MILNGQATNKELYILLLTSLKRRYFDNRVNCPIIVHDFVKERPFLLITNVDVPVTCKKLNCLIFCVIYQHKIDED